ncbi:MAG: hypothetical protein KJ072_11165 [Verrucomicrobia bacterium]|nr:hypothetical protein [Verrucomicrobiota bacterium]
MNRVFRLSEVINKKIKEIGNVHRLSRLIEEANANAEVKGKIAPRTLRKLAFAPEGVGLTLSNLIALDNYLAPIGEGLHDKPIFERRGILEYLVEKPQVTFLVGAKPRIRERRIDLSWWDTRSAAELVGQIRRVNPAVHYDIVEVLLRTPVRPARLTADPWHRWLEAEDCSVVAIGSPRANLASEIMLAQMFGVRPFVKPSLTFLDPKRGPFAFVWPRPLMQGWRSAFALGAEDLPPKSRHLATQVRRNRSGAFVIGTRILPIPRGHRNYTTYGVIVAQRRPNGRVWAVILGESGPATYAMATKVREINAELPVSSQTAPKVLWAPIEAQIRTTASSIGDHRQVKSASFLEPPELWPPEAHSPPSDGRATAGEGAAGRRGTA